MRGRVVLAHEFHYDMAAIARTRARPPKGAHAAPTGTLAGIPSREGNGFVPNGPRYAHALGTDLASGDPRAPADSLAPAGASLIERVRAFLTGSPVAFDDVELDLDWATPFQRSLNQALRGIPRGEVVTYGELAALAGRPGAARAAGTFCATNRFALVVPCHRVVAAGGIGGYGPDGVPIKRRLLALEGVRM
jgi:methylated-DNA-[protein]-cysteine S-methyltransferase